MSYSYTAIAFFEGTLEGQVSIEPNDPLLLLNDSNNLWWYVKNLRLNKVGYVPAEFVELPFERVARYNRAKNIEQTKPLQEEINLAPKIPAKHKKVVFEEVEPQVTKESPVLGFASFLKSTFTIRNWITERSKWVKKYFQFGKSKLEMLKIYSDNLNTTTLCKTILLDQTMSVSNLILASMKRFGLEKENKENYRILITIEDEVIIPDENDLIMNILSKYSSYFSQGTGKIQLSKRLKRTTSSDTSASIVNQKRLSNSVILLSSHQRNLNSQEFSDSIDKFYESIKSDNIDSFKESLDNISSFEKMYKEIMNDGHVVSSKARSKSEYEQAKDLLNHNFITDVNENMELVRALKDNLEALVLISIKLYP